jgi:6-phosphofructokinase
LSTFLIEVIEGGGLKEVVAIVVGGGPAPGINGVVSAATIEALEHGKEVIGIRGGINSLYAGDHKTIMKCAMRLTLENIDNTENSGGSILLTSRGLPKDIEKAFSTMMSALRTLKVRYLMTIGGEGTAYVAKEIARISKGRISVIHVPKSIDNDLPLPGWRPSFGFETARHWGVKITRNLGEDARSTRRWYFIQSMGRHTGHLALGIGKAAGASVTLIPEEFQAGSSFRRVADILEGAVIKRLALGKDYGTAILAEGIIGRLDHKELARHNPGLPRDELGRVNLSRIELSRFMQEMVCKSLEERGVKVKILNKEVGYELRAAPPIPFDAEYTMNLGYGAIKYLLHLGGSGAMVIFDGGKLQSIPFAEMTDKKTGLIKVRYVDPSSESYMVARDYMFRLEKEDLENPKWLEKLARTARMSVAEFRNRFEPTIKIG